MEPVVQQFGERIRQIRLERRLSIEELADLTGMGAPMIRTIERGDSPPSFQKLILLAQALRVDVVYLFVVPHLNPVHDLFELVRRASKPAVIAMRAACQGVLDAMRFKPANEKRGA